MFTSNIGLNPNQTGMNQGFGSPDIMSLLGGNPAMNRLGGGGGIPQVVGLDSLMAPSFGGMDPNAQAMEAQTSLLQMMMTLLTSLMSNSGGNQSGAQDSGSGSGSGSSVSQISNGGGGGGSSSGGGGGSDASMMSSSSTGGGAAASVDMAKKYLGQSAISLKGKLDNYTAAGGTGNDCADFVSGILANTQGFKKTGGDASVATFKTHLEQQGWKKVSKAQSKAGDVVIFNGSQHTELVTKDGGAEAIGSNGGSTNQTIKTDSLSWGSQEFYHKG